LIGLDFDLPVEIFESVFYNEIMFRELIIILLSSFVYAGEIGLLAITHHGCSVCQLWHEEVAPYYDMEAEKMHLPALREYDISDTSNREWVKKNIGVITNLPTFVVMEDDKVLNLFVGYTGYKKFFNELRGEISKVSSKSKA
jgi:hypothetical protein